MILKPVIAQTEERLEIQLTSMAQKVTRLPSSLSQWRTDRVLIYSCFISPSLAASHFSDSWFNCLWLLLFRGIKVWQDQINVKHCVQSFPRTRLDVGAETGIFRFSAAIVAICRSLCLLHVFRIVFTIASTFSEHSYWDPCLGNMLILPFQPHCDLD